jgi:hypothetical protein
MNEDELLPEQEEEDQPCEPAPVSASRRLIARVLRRALVATLAATTLAMIASHWMPLKYTGTTKFTLRSDSAGLSPRTGHNDDLEEIRLTLPYELLDRRAVEKVIRDLGLDKGMPHNEQGELTREGKQRQQDLVRNIQEQTKIAWEVRSQEVDLIAVSVTAPDRALAQKIPNELVKNYIERTSAQITTRLCDSNSFLTSQVLASSKRLKELENQRVAFQKQYARMMPESPGYVQKEIDDIVSEMARLGRDKQAAMDRLREAINKIVYTHDRYPRALEALGKADANALRTLVARHRKHQPPPAESVDSPKRKPAGDATTMPAPQPIRVIWIKNPEIAEIENRIAEIERAVGSEMISGTKTEDHPDLKTLRRIIKNLRAKQATLPEKVVFQEIYEADIREPIAEIAAPPATPTARSRCSRRCASTHWGRASTLAWIRTSGRRRTRGKNWWP